MCALCSSAVQWLCQLLNHVVPWAAAKSIVQAALQISQQLFMTNRWQQKQSATNLLDLQINCKQSSKRETKFNMVHAGNSNSIFPQLNLDVGSHQQQACISCYRNDFSILWSLISLWLIIAADQWIAMIHVSLGVPMIHLPLCSAVQTPFAYQMLCQSKRTPRHQM